MKKRIVNNTVVFSFDGLPDVVFDSTAAHPEDHAHAAMHGWMQKHGDCAAIQKTEANGYRVTEQMRRDAVLESVARFSTGERVWNVRTAKQPAQNPTILAIAEKRECTYAEAEAFLAAQFLDEMN